MPVDYFCEKEANWLHVSVPNEIVLIILGFQHNYSHLCLDTPTKSGVSNECFYEKSLENDSITKLI